MKRSDGSSPGRPENKYTYYIERPLAKGPGLALRERGFSVVLHLEVFPDDRTDDEVWINRVAAEGWVALGADVRLRWTPTLKRAVYNARLRLFNLTNNNGTGPEKAAAFVQAMPAIGRLLARRAGPFIAKVNMEGKIVGVYDFSDYKP